MTVKNTISRPVLRKLALRCASLVRLIRKIALSTGYGLTSLSLAFVVLVDYYLIGLGSSSVLKAIEKGKLKWKETGETRRQ